MKKYLAIVLTILVGAFTSSALLITPTDPSLVLTGTQTSNAEILSLLDDYFAGLGLDISLLYKAEEGNGAEEGEFAPYYSTVFSPPGDAENALITWYKSSSNLPSSPLDYISSEHVYLLVKDGNHQPPWYLFDLRSAGWDGREDLEIRGFWPGKGSISHVTIFGSEPTNIPDGGATLVLLGFALVALAGAKRCFVG